MLNQVQVLSILPNFLILQLLWPLVIENIEFVRRRNEDWEQKYNTIHWYNIYISCLSSRMLQNFETGNVLAEFILENEGIAYILYLLRICLNWTNTGTSAESNTISAHYYSNVKVAGKTYDFKCLAKQHIVERIDYRPFPINLMCDINFDWKT